MSNQIFISHVTADDAVVKELREALRLDPDEAETLSRLGEWAKERGKLDDAIAFWNEAKRKRPGRRG